jgi:hypothetical protein
MAVAVIELDDVDAMRRAVVSAPSRHRLAGGVLSGSRVALSVRDPGPDAARRRDALVHELARQTTVRGVGAVSIAGAEVSASIGQELLGMAERTLNRVLAQGGGVQNVVLQSEVLPLPPA